MTVISSAPIAITASPAPRANVRRRRNGAILAVAAAAVLLVLLHDRLPDPAPILAALAGCDPRWIAAAAGVQFLSQLAFALQQRSLLAGAGVPVRLPTALAITYSRSAISSVLPAGGAVSAAFALHQYRRHGATTPTAAAVTILSGLASTAGLALLGAGSLIDLVKAHPTPTAAIAAAATCTVFAARRAGRWPAAARITGHLRQAAADARAIGPRALATAVAYAAANWLLDAYCLVIAAHATGLTLPWHTLLGAYLTVQLARQIPLTPGGIGVIEAGLLAALTTAGAPAAGAAAAILIYRLVSFWLNLPPGLATYATLRRS